MDLSPVTSARTPVAPPPIASLALAPMDGVTDDIVRSVISAMGGVDYCVTEFLRVSSDVIVPKVFLRECPELQRGTATPTGTPVHLQLLGGDPDRMARSAATAVSLGATVIDLNFGCPAPTVNRHDGGATLLKDPSRVERVVRAVRDAVPGHVPVSAKVRLGWEDPDDIVSIVRAAEAGGAAWITVHARTRVQGYQPPADWERIGRARCAVRVPVVANGDLSSPEAVARCAEVSGCDRFMLGRGAIERPELFRVLRGLDAGFWSPGRRLGVVQRFLDESLARGPDREHVTVCRAKQWLRALGRGDARLQPVFEQVRRLEDLDAVRDALTLASVRAEASIEQA